MKEARLQDSTAYGCWRNMKARCYIKGSTGWENYGGRGIRVCDRWLGRDGFKNFLEDMGPRPTRIHSIERKHNDKDYTPSNCRWATPDEQAANRRKGPSLRTLEIASVLASGAASADVATSYNLSPQRVRQIREEHVGEGKVGRPRTRVYTHQTVAGRELLVGVTAIAQERGWDPADLLAWIHANLPKKQ